MVIGKRRVKRYVLKLEGATQKREFWGQIWGQNRAGGMIWGDEMTLNVR